jgi:hypothetical protein
MKKLLLITIFLLSPFSVFASENWKLREAKNTLSIQGSCSSEKIKIELYAKTQSDSIYTSNAVCKEGTFEFSDNLLQWKSIADGQYTVIINGDKQNPKTISIEKPQEVKPVEVEKTVKKETEKPLSPELKFLNAFATLQQSILDMKQWLGETSYSKFAKQTINLALDSVDVAVGKLSGRVLSSEDSQQESITDLATAPSKPETQNQTSEKIVENKVDQSEIPAIIEPTEKLPLIETNTDALQVN